jgi:adenosylcobinamide amidohydrolase
MVRGPRKPDPDDLGHLHFIDVLRDVQTVLKRLPVTQADGQATLSSKKVTPASLFAHLDALKIQDESVADEQGQTALFLTVGMSDSIPSLPFFADNNSKNPRHPQPTGTLLNPH